MLVLYRKIVQRLILQHWQVNGDIRSRFSTEFEVDCVHSGTHAKRLFVGHIAGTHSVSARISHNPTSSLRRLSLLLLLLLRT